MTNLLKNGDFESEWSEENGGHLCYVYDVDTFDCYTREIGNIFVSPDWSFYFLHKPGTYDQPEGRDARTADRVRSGAKAYSWFTFHRNHWAGLSQQVQVTLGERLRFTAWMHAWSNGVDDSGHLNDPRWSDGAGFEHVAWKVGGLPHNTGDPQIDAKPNFTFSIGIDPTGGTNPNSGAVIWGDSYHIYNGYCKQLQVEAVAIEETVTVFVESRTLWPFKHNDAYIDDAELVVLNDPAKPRGTPREQYARVYVLLPQQYIGNAEWVAAAAGPGYTVGFSADDAGIGDLDQRLVIAVNPSMWEGDLLAFFEAYYPGVSYVPVEAATPAELAEKLG